MSDDPKSRSEIDKRLSDEEREALFALVEGSTLKEGVAWLKKHHEIELSPTALGKWAEKQRRQGKDVAFQQLVAGLRYDTEQAGIVAAEIGSAAQLNDANVLLLGQALFSARRTGDPGEIKNAAKIFAMVLEANAKAKTAEANVIVAETGRDKFQFDAAKAALAHAAELQRISTSAGTEREKILRAIEAVFGRRPDRAVAGEINLAGDDLGSSDRPSPGTDIQNGAISDDSFLKKPSNKSTLEKDGSSNISSNVEKKGGG